MKIKLLFTILLIILVSCSKNKEPIDVELLNWTTDEQTSKNVKEYGWEISLEEKIFYIKDVEEHIDHIAEVLAPQTSFILPGGTIASSFLHLCCSITRRTERVLVKASNDHLVNPSVLCYVNRLSDLLFVLARRANNELEVKEQQPIYKYFNGVNTHE